MRTRLGVASGLLITVAGAMIAAAPAALAVNVPIPTDCTAVGGAGTVCGDMSINDAPEVQFTPQYPYWEGSGIFGPGGPGIHSHR